MRSRPTARIPTTSPPPPTRPRRRRLRRGPHRAGAGAGAENQPLGVVTAIVGQTYLASTVLGEAGHAGTVPMPHAPRCACGRGRGDAARSRSIARETKADDGRDRRPHRGRAGRDQCHPGDVVAFIFDIRSGTDAARTPSSIAKRGAASPIAAIWPHHQVVPRGRDHAVPSASSRTCLRGDPRARPSTDAAAVRAPGMTDRRWRSSVRSACCSCAAAAASATIRWSMRARAIWASRSRR